MAVLDEEQPLTFGKCGAQIRRLADQAGLALLADAALEDRLDEDELVPVEHVLDLGLARGRAQDFGDRKLDVPQERCAVEKTCELHGGCFLVGVLWRSDRPQETGSLRLQSPRQAIRVRRRNSDRIRAVGLMV